MHVCVIVDQERLTRERDMLTRIGRGLTDSDWQLTTVLPEPPPGVQTGGQPELPCDQELRTRMRVQPWLRRLRATQLANQLRGSAPDLVHAVGDHAWAVALDVGRLVERPVTLDVWSAEQVPRVPAGRARARIAACIAASQPIAAALRERVEPEIVVAVPPGVEPPPKPTAAPRNSRESVSLAIIGSGRDPVGHRALLTGLSRLVVDRPQIQACLELRGPYEHDIWRHARRLDLLSHVSSIVDAAMHRPLLTGCDVLVVPERLGQVRSLLLQAMAAGMPVVAADDPWLDMLIAEQTAVIVDQLDADAWAAALRRVLDDAELVARLAEGARRHVLEHHRPSDQLDHLTATFRQIVSGGAHSFAGELP